MSSKWKTRKSPIEITVFSISLLAKSKDTNSTDECICIYGPELGSYCFSSNSDVSMMWALSKTPLKIYMERNSLLKFRMLQIEEGKHVYYIYTLVTLTLRTEVILVR